MKIILPYSEYVKLVSNTLAKEFGSRLKVATEEMFDNFAKEYVFEVIRMYVYRKQRWYRQTDTIDSIIRRSLHHFGNFYKDDIADIVNLITVAIDEIRIYIYDFINNTFENDVFDVYCLEKTGNYIIVTNCGDYRILKYETEHPECLVKTDNTLPEEIVYMHYLAISNLTRQ